MPLPEVTPVDIAVMAKDLIESRAKLLDVREPAEWEAGHFLSASPAPLSGLKRGIYPEDRDTG